MGRSVGLGVRRRMMMTFGEGVVEWVEKMEEG